MTASQKALPPTRLNGLLAKPVCRQAGEGRGEAVGWPASTDPTQLRNHPATPQIHAPSHEAGVKLGDGVAGEAASPRQKGLNPHPKPMGDLDLPDSTWTSAVTLSSASCSPALRPTTCHDTPSYDGALLPPPAWMRLPTGAGP